MRFITVEPKSTPTDLAGEAWGGFAAMLVAVPSSIAYGVVAYEVLGPEYAAHGAMAGILGAIALGLIVPLLGGAPRLISAPCAPAAAVLTALAGDLLTGARGSIGPLAPPQALPLLTLVALMAGALQLLQGAVGGGRIIKYIPYQVVSGYLSGVGTLILLGQVPSFLGLPKGMPTWSALVSPGLWHWPGIIIGSVTVAGILIAPRITAAVPAVILGLAAGILTSCGLGLLPFAPLRPGPTTFISGHATGPGNSVVDGILASWSSLGHLPLESLPALLVPALTLSVLLSIDTLKTCVVMDAMTRSRHDSNRTLLGQGFGNLASALFGGMPGAGTLGATMVNLNSGGRTRLSSALEGAMALAVLPLLGWFLGWLPVGALAGILLVVGSRMIDREIFHLLKQKSTLLDFSIIAAVIIVAVAMNLIAAAGAGLVLAILLFIREQMRGPVIHRKLRGDQVSSKQSRLPSEKEALLVHGHLTTVCELQGTLFFGTTDRLYTELEPDLRLSRFVILDLRRVQSVDFTAAHLLKQIESILAERGAHLVFSGLSKQPATGRNLEAYFVQLGLADPSSNVRIIGSLEEAIEWAENRILEEAHLLQTGHEPPLELAEIELLRELEADNTLSALRACVVERTVEAGQAIFKRGDAGGELFLIRRGAVRILLPLEDGGHLTLAAFGRGNFFGDMSFLDGSMRSADAVAERATDLFVISRARFNEVVYTHPLVGVKVFARLARALAVRLRYTDAELRGLSES
jgi:sulfate permease, SulP family